MDAPVTLLPEDDPKEQNRKLRSIVEDAYEKFSRIDTSIYNFTDDQVIKQNIISTESDEVDPDIATHESTYDHGDLHTRKHDMDGSSDHNSPSGTANNLVDFDASGYPVDDSGLSVTDTSDAITKKHVRQHAIDTAADHTSTITENNLMDGDANGLPDDSGIAVEDVVESPAVIVDHTLVRGDGGAKNVQDTRITCDDSDNLASIGTISSGAATINGASTIGDGGATNYSAFAADGILSMVGTAKVLKSHTFTFNFAQITGQGKPTLVNRGVFFGFSLPTYAADEELFSCLCMPGDWDGSTDPIIYIGGWLDTANTSKKFNMQVSVETADYSSNAVVPATTNDYPVETTTGTWAQFTSFMVGFTIDASAVGFAVRWPLAIRIRRLAASVDEIAGEVVVEGAVMLYAADKLGIAT